MEGGKEVLAGKILIYMEMYGVMMNNLLLTRAIFYVCHLVSSQKERDFANIMRSR